MKEPIRIALPTLHHSLMVNTYLFLDPEPVLVDCGLNTPESWIGLNSALNKHGISLKDLKKIIITHAHIDHMGLAGRIANESEATIWVNEYSYPWAIDIKKKWGQRAQLIENLIRTESPPHDLDNASLSNLSNFLYQALDSWDNVPEKALRIFMVGDVLTFGGGKWEVIYAPGHSNTQTCFYEPTQQWFLSADMLLSSIPPPAIEFLNDDIYTREVSLVTMMKSMEAMKRLKINKVFPGHYNSFSDHVTLIDRQIARIHQRKEECAQLIQKGANRFFDIHEKMYNSPANIFTISMLRGYLDVLIAEETIFGMEQSGYMAYFVR